MTDEQKASFVAAQVACANAEISAMQAENACCMMSGLSPAWTYEDFMKILDSYVIGHNAVIEFFRT